MRRIIPKSGHKVVQFNLRNKDIYSIGNRFVTRAGKYAIYGFICYRSEYNLVFYET